MTEGWLAQSAEDFWTAVGYTLPYPRDVRYIVSRAFPLSVISLPHLCVQQVEAWLQHHYITFRFLCQDRSLCGCIIAVRGHGLIFVDSLDADAEQRYTIAHETAHFLLDYHYSRRQALSVFGERILPVLDGERAPTQNERLDAFLSSVKLGSYSDLMPRSQEGGLDQGYILRAEQKADRFALELLAPAAQVIPEIFSLSAPSPVEHLRVAAQLLTSIYGLPPSVAKKYSDLLLRPRLRPSIARWFGL